jgi:hypothetical protein
MRVRRRRTEDPEPSRLEELCCQEERMLDSWSERLDPMGAAAAEARVEQACERLDQRRSKPPRSPL